MAAQKPARASPELRTAPLSPRYLGIYTTLRDTARIMKIRTLKPSQNVVAAGAKLARKNDSSTYTYETGKFAHGNPGKPKGARHKTTRAVEELLNGQSEAITQKAVDLALAGDTLSLDGNGPPCIQLHARRVRN